jgi:membrane protein involved in colicin uptake
MNTSIYVKSIFRLLLIPLAAGLFSSCSRRPVYTSVAPTQAYGSVYNQPYAPGATVNRNYNVPRQLSIDSIDQSIDGLKLQQAAIKEDLKAGNLDEQTARTQLKETKASLKQAKQLKRAQKKAERQAKQSQKADKQAIRAQSRLDRARRKAERKALQMRKANDELREQNLNVPNN